MTTLLLVLALATSPICDVNDPVLPDNHYPIVVLETSLGAIEVELDRRKAPITVNNFLRYVVEGRYDGTIFHRVVPGFVAQTGGYDADFVERPEHAAIFNESGNGLDNRKYSIAMARHSDPHSAQAQFYINLADNDGLNPNSRSWGYTVFGQVINGYEVVDQFNDVQTGYHADLDSEEVPVTPITLLSVKVK